MCKHDPQFRIDFEAAGGHGCPLCRLENSRATARTDEAQRALCIDDIAQRHAGELNDERAKDLAAQEDVPNAKHAAKGYPNGWAVNPATQLWGESPWQPHPPTEAKA